MQKIKGKNILTIRQKKNKSKVEYKRAEIIKSKH